MLKDEEAGYFHVEISAGGHRFVGERCVTCTVTWAVYESNNIKCKENRDGEKEEDQEGASGRAACVSE